MSDFVIRHNEGSSVKALKTPGLVEGYLVTWGNPRDTDLEREYFTPQTNLCLNWFEERPVLYHHGMDRDVGLKSIGVIKSYKVDDMGLWVQAQLDMADKYAQAVYDMISAQKNNNFGWSSGSVEHLVEVAPSGEIQTWPIIEGSITPTPAQPAKTTIYARPVRSAAPRVNSAAFKSLIHDSNWVRELDARVSSFSISKNANSAKAIGEHTMAISKGAARRIANAALNAYGIKADADDLNEVAAEVAPVVEDEVATMQDDGFDESVMGDDLDAEIMAIMADLEDDAMMEDDDLSLMGADGFIGAVDSFDDDDALMGDDFDEDIMAIMADLDDDALMGDLDDDALMGDDEEFFKMDDDEEFGEATMRGKSVNFSDSDTAYELRRLQRQVARLSRPADGEGAVGRYKSLSVVDQADRPGAYADAFKAYLGRGMAALYDHQKYTLNSRRDNWGPATAGTTITGVKSVKAFNAGADTSVGFAVPPDWLRDLNKNIMTEAAMAGECKTRVTSSDRVIQPDLVTTDARRAYPTQVRWPGESPAAASDTDATEWSLAQLEIPVHVMLMNYIATQSSLEDLSFNLQQEISSAFGEAVAVAYDTLIWAGDGQGKMLGITTDDRVTGAESTSVSSVSGYVKSGAASSIPNGDPIKQMFMNLPAGYRRNAKWYGNSNTILAISQLKTSDGLYLWDVNNAAGLRGGLPDNILGRPIVYNEFSTDVAANAFPLMLADLSRAYTIAQRVEFSVRRFDEVYAINDQVLFIGRARVGGQVTLPPAIKVLKISA